MPVKPGKQQRFMGMCSTAKGQAKAKGKCPSIAVAKEMLHGSSSKKKGKKS